MIKENFDFNEKIKNLNEKIEKVNLITDEKEKMEKTRLLIDDIKSEYIQRTFDYMEELMTGSLVKQFKQKMLDEESIADNVHLCMKVLKELLGKIED